MHQYELMVILDPEIDERTDARLVALKCGDITWCHSVVRRLIRIAAKLDQCTDA